MKQAQLAVFKILIFYLIAFGIIFFGVLHYAQAANKHSGLIDKCVVGKWSLDKSSLDRFYRSIVGDADNLELISSESKTQFTLTSGGDAAGNIYQKTTTRSKATSMNMESTVTIKGTSSAKFHADGQRLRYWDIKDNTKVDSKMLMNGVEMPMPKMGSKDDRSLFPKEGLEYECGGGVLKIYMPVDKIDAPPLEYKKM